MGHLCFGPSAGCPGGQGLLSGGGAVRASTEALVQRELWVGVRHGQSSISWGEALVLSFRGIQTLPSVSLNWPPLVSMVFLAPSTSCGLGRGLSRGGPGDPWGPGEQVPAEMPWGSGIFPDALALGVRGRPWCFSHSPENLHPSLPTHRQPSGSRAQGHPQPLVTLGCLRQGPSWFPSLPLCMASSFTSSSREPSLTTRTLCAVASSPHPALTVPCWSVCLSPLLVFKLCGGRTQVCLPQLSAWHPGQAGFTGGA